MSLPPASGEAQMPVLQVYNLIKSMYTDEDILVRFVLSPL